MEISQGKHVIINTKTVIVLIINFSHCTGKTDHIETHYRRLGFSRLLTSKTQWVFLSKSKTN